MLGLRVVAHRDGTLVPEWSAGAGARRTLRPDEPGLSGSAPETGLDLPAPSHLLPESSDSQR